MADHDPTIDMAARRDTYRDEHSSIAAGSICERPVDGPRLVDPKTGLGLHPACAAQGLPQDAVVWLLAALALVLVPPIAVWAG
jgi:hypothetical protein